MIPVGRRHSAEAKGLVSGGSHRTGWGQMGCRIQLSRCHAAVWASVGLTESLKPVYIRIRQPCASQVAGGSRATDFCSAGLFFSLLLFGRAAIGMQ
jgi:hypothetical protein